MEAVRTLIAWAGDNPDREGLIDTPKRVVNAYSEWFRGYDQDPAEVLSRVFEDVSGYDDMVILRDIDIVMIDAKHQCMSTRGVHHPDVSTITTQFTGEFKTNPALQDRFLRVIGK